MTTDFSFKRLWGIIIKEFIQMKRDRVTLAMMLVLPIIQLILFGYAINSNPKSLPTAIVSADESSFIRSFISSLQNTDYFDITYPKVTEDEADRLLAKGDILFIINIPAGFTRDFIREQTPDILITADATDPIATANAISALGVLANDVFNLDLSRGLGGSINNVKPFNLVIHSKYNPEAINQYNTVPGLMGLILTITMVMITGIAITREFERGTMEGLLSMPVQPLEVITGKILPYIFVGYFQQGIILLAGMILFDVPMKGSALLLIFSMLPFIAANLSVGLTFSTMAKNQLQAVQMTNFFFLPSILLSGFMFPFKGMPEWAQWIGNILPLSHFLRITRGIMLKGNGLIEIWPEIWPILVFTIIALAIAFLRYRRTLD